MDGFRTQFDTLVHHNYRLHGADCTYTRDTDSWTVRLVPHIAGQYVSFGRMSGMASHFVLFRAIVSSQESWLSGKTASETFITPKLGDKITLSSETYSISPSEEAPRGWRYLNDRRNQIEIYCTKDTPNESH